MSNEPIAERLGRAAWADSPVRGPDETWEDLPDVGQQAWIRIGQAVRFALDEDARIAELESQLGQAHEALTVLQDALRQAGHADECALQYGGACSCRMQLVRRSSDGL